jgi:3-hydroxymyristoyl/3-hydroxydecanoyl-(acyl carrier protein) dehydratase
MKLVPDVVSSRVGAYSAVYALDIAADLHAFEGHYPGNPILPGVVQVDWAMRFAREAFAGSIAPVDWAAFSGIEQLKFHKIITPGERLELKLDWDAAAGKLAFSFEADGERKSAGQIKVKPR